MSSITPPADDVGLQSLRQDNLTDTDVKSVSNIAAKRAIHQPTGAPAADRPYIEKRHRIERRKKDRRRENKGGKKRLLDTRSQYNRRTNARRSLERKRSPHMRGVNIKV